MLLAMRHVVGSVANSVLQQQLCSHGRKHSTWSQRLHMAAASLLNTACFEALLAAPAALR
jgi:hypothetical protein